MENIQIDLIIPHKDNPRKDLGDLTELADSIRENGIFQNLTVHDNEDGTYTAIIGHRRLEAAKLAGMTEVPCVIVSMDEQTQASTMLLENMQRTDLTPYEQAQGFQMCLDLGLTESDLSKKTGLSKKTVKHRLEMLKLDKEKFEESRVQGGTIEDYIKLEGVENEEKRNELLKYIGTPSFNYKVNEQVDLEKKAKAKAEQIRICRTFAIELDKYPNGKKRIRCYNSSDTILVPEDYEVKQYYFYDYYGIEVYVDYEKEVEPTKPKVDKKAEDRKVRREALEQAFNIARETRLNFIKEYLKSGERKHEVEKTYLIYASFGIFDFYPKSEIAEKLMGIEFEFVNDSTFIDYLKNLSEKKRDQLAFCALYSFLETDTDLPTADWRLEYDEDEEYAELYRFLTLLGYEASEEEVKLLDGTHELFEANKQLEEEQPEELEDPEDLSDKDEELDEKLLKKDEERLEVAIFEESEVNDTE